MAGTHIHIIHVMEKYTVFISYIIELIMSTVIMETNLV